MKRFLRFCRSYEDFDTEEYAYRVYMTDSAQYAAQNKYLTNRWVDIIERKHEPTMTGDEIAAMLIERAGLIVKGGEQNGCI